MDFVGWAVVIVLINKAENGPNRLQVLFRPIEMHSHSRAGLTVVVDQGLASVLAHHQIQPAVMVEIA